MRPKKILCGMEERELGRLGVEAAFDLARRFDADLELLHSVPLETEVWAATVALDWMKVRVDVLEASKRRCVERLEAWFPERKDIDSILELDDRKPGRALVDRARAWPADLIVLGRHEKHLLDMGGTARWVLHHAPCPVWMQTRTVDDIERILLPVDPFDYDPADAAWARELANSFGARITLLFAFQPPSFAYEPLHSNPNPFPVDEVRAAARKRFEEIAGLESWGGVDVSTLVVDGDAAGAILEHQHERDLVVMGTHGRSAIGRFVLGSVTQAVVENARCPVLAVPMDPSKRQVPEEAGLAAATEG